MKQFSQVWPALPFSFTQDGYWKTVDVPSGVDPDAKLVTIEVVCIANQQVGICPVDSNIPEERTKWPMPTLSTISVTIPVVSGQVKLLGYAGAVFRVTAEWGGDMVVVPGGLQNAPGWNEENTGTYRDHDLTGYFGDDAGNVEAVICYLRRSYIATPDTDHDHADVRPEGSTYDEVDTATQNSNAGSVVKVVNPTNIVEVREGAHWDLKGGPVSQKSWAYFVGYILKGMADDGGGNYYTYRAAEDPVDDGVGSDAWENYDVEEKTSSDVHTIYWRMVRQAGSYHKHYAQEVDSPENPQYQRNERFFLERAIEVDENKEVKHWFEVGATVRSYVFGWLDFDGLVPGQATNPSPAVSGTANPAVLAWMMGSGATSSDVYLGTSPTLGSGEYKGNQAGASYAPGALLPSTTYYWRIDSVNGAFTTTGAVWTFTTPSACDWFFPDPGADWKSDASPGDWAVEATEKEWAGAATEKEWAGAASGSSWFVRKRCS